MTEEGIAVPPTARAVRRTPSFTKTSMPAALGRSHLTSVWAELVVEEGSVLFDEDQSRCLAVHAGHRITIVPRVAHRIEPTDDAVFHVQFYR